MVLIDNLTRSETFVYFTAYRGLGEFSRRYFRFMSWLVNEEVFAGFDSGCGRLAIIADNRVSAHTKSTKYGTQIQIHLDNKVI